MRNVCVVGYDVADALFRGAQRARQKVLINGHAFKSNRDTHAPGHVSRAFQSRLDRGHSAARIQKYFSAKSEADVRSKGARQDALADATRRTDRHHAPAALLPPEKRDDFSINEQQAFKSTLDRRQSSRSRSPACSSPVCRFSSGAIGIMNITFVSVKGADEGDRHAQSVRRARAGQSCFSFSSNRPRSALSAD